jgi:hypothetical protein
VIAGQIISGHILLADWLFLVAAVLFAVAAVAIYVRQTVPRDWIPCLVPAGLCLIAVAWLVL